MDTSPLSRKYAEVTPGKRKRVNIETRDQNPSKRYVGLLLMFLLLLSASLACNSNMATDTPPPATDLQETSERGGILAIVIDPFTPTMLYMTTMRSGVFKSTDGGQNWSSINNDITNTNIGPLAIDPITPSTLYAGARNCPGTKGILKSANGGENWSIANTGLNTMVSDIAVDPFTQSILYAGTDDGGVFKSADGGGNWSPVNAGMTTSWIKVLAIDPVTPTTLYAGTGNSGVFKSTDAGKNWRVINTGLTNLVVYTLAIDPVMPMTLYVGTYEGAFKSTDSGENWRPINTGLTKIGASYLLGIDTIVLDPLTPATLYAGTTSDGVFKSTDGGENWRMITELPESDSDYVEMLVIDSLAIDPLTPTTLYAGTWGSGVLKSTDGGESWYAVNTGLPAMEIMSEPSDN
jgi:photosystem II stability/assembly factor-like uncharacterized protein